MNLPVFIASRYLFARKSHNVINIISAISVAGMAVGTAALILILSVYNGFDRIIRSSLSDLDPDVKVCADSGKFFIPSEELAAKLCSDPRVATISSVIEDNVFLSYGGTEGIARAKGVDSVFEETSPVAEHCTSGEFTLHRGDRRMAAVGAGLAYRLGLRPNFLAPIEMYFPERNGQISPSDPAASLRRVGLSPSCIFSITADTDAELMIVPLEVMQELLDIKDDTPEITSLEIRLKPAGPRVVNSFIKDYDGTEGLRFLGRYAQHESLYRMMRFEKAAIFIILMFVVIIIGFSIFGSLSMLVMEKKQDIGTLRAMGASDKLIRRIFVLEGWMVSLLGMTIGLIIGVVLVLIQQHFGIVGLPGNFMVSAYPVELLWSDIVLVAAGVAVTGYIIALLPVRKDWRPRHSCQAPYKEVR
ncbi:MAG: ABC transporter permease [Bacteroidales bacterium]|nr:ABC transporter permease [Bacteroidales bacterium]